ncbi:hypothetical protein ADL15_49485 [Actinoplanes awajinensis subsp. mycoplanecinus]|uniref:Uncharacterized protein n=2 Tax=Actinoplanes awajinensis TaxID=135946 RepID=A0A101J886_9ACTN|nr:hypothetical protein ADL15_49485 [Actinoplanes awajinensis subsp. mycoplanecinus]
MVAGVLSAVVAVAAWQWPKSPAPDPAPAPTAGAATTAGGATTAAPATTTGGAAPATAAGPTAVYLDTLTVEAGKANLVAVPRAIRDKPEFADHPIAVSCPSNQPGDQARDVTWRLGGHYLDFRAEVRPYYPAGTDTGGATYVFAVAGTRQKDGTLSTTEAGRQQTASVTSPKPLTGAVEGVEQLTIRVQCGNPKGVVVLTAATVTPS